MNKVTPEEKFYAQTLHRYGVNTNSIATELSRTWTTVQRMLDPEKVRAASKDYYQRNKEIVLAGQKRYLQTEKGIATRKRYDNSEKGKARDLRFNATDKGLTSKCKRQAKRRQRKTNCLEYVFLDNRWRLVDREATWVEFKEVLLPKEESDAIEALYAKAKELSKDGTPRHVDHIWPLAKGGEHRLYNLQILKDWENTIKRDDWADGEIRLMGQRLFFSDEYTTAI